MAGGWTQWAPSLWPRPGRRGARRPRRPCWGRCARWRRRRTVSGGCGARDQAAAPGRVNLQYCISSVGQAAARAVWGPAAHYARTGTISCRCWARPLLEQRWYTGQGGWFDTRKIVKTIDKTMTSSSTALSSQGSGRAMARPETWHWTEQQKAWRPSSQASLSFLALLVDVYRSRCLRPVSRWSPLSHYIRLHRLGCTTAASTRGHCWSWSPPWGWTRPGV